MLTLRALMGFCPSCVKCVKWFPQALRLFGLFSWAFFCMKCARFTAVHTGNAKCFLQEEKGFDENFPLM